MNMLLKLLLGPIGAVPEESGSGASKKETPPSARKPGRRKPAKVNGFVRVLLSLVITALFGIIYFYFQLPALNIHAGGFYGFLFLLLVVFTVAMILLGRFRGKGFRDYVAYSRKTLVVPFWGAVLILAVVIVGALSGLVIFRAKAYSQLISMDTGDFAAEVAEINWKQIPLLDEDSANNLANRKLGELSDLVSQFTVSNSSAQINYNGAPVRVNYLNYGGVFKWWNNRAEGIPAYMIIDMRTQEVSVERLEEGIHYSPSEYLNHDLSRHLRFSFPTLMFGDVNFEIDESGTPYWVASVIDKTIGLFDGTDVIGAVLVNATTGESAYYDVADVPSWVDRVYSADLIIDQYNYYGQYHNGFWNSLFGQTDCTITTSGSNFIAQDDDVWVYTGITSVTGDRGNIGFILVNQRTKEARYYSCAGAEEYSASASAEGAVQQYTYKSTFPLLLNISDEPTYFMALKDAAGLVKMYAMVNVQQYQIVATGFTVSECQQNYHSLLLENNIITGEEIVVPPEQAQSTARGVLAEIRSANIDGNTLFYLRFENEGVYYTVSAKDYPIAAVLNVGDRVTVTYVPTEDILIPVSTMTRS